MNQLIGRIIINHIEKESDSQKHLSKFTKGKNLTGSTKHLSNKLKHLNRVPKGNNLTDSVKLQ